MLIQVFPSGPFATNAYVVTCEKTSKAAIIDPAPGSCEQIELYLKENNFTPTKILLTHSHWDHIADVQPLKEKYKIPVFVHPLDAPNLMEVGQDGIPCWLTIPSVQPNGFLTEGEKILVGDLEFVVIETPGHSPGGICLYNLPQKVLFSGDTLFKGTIGNLSFPTCSAESMWQSLKKLEHLPHETRVYPGHGPSTTIGNESWLPRAEELFG